MEKNTAKKFLISTLSLFLATLIISALVVFTITGTGHSRLELPTYQLFLICIGCALVPTGSFVGFFTAFSKIEELTKPVILAICVLFPITICIITIYGILAVIPFVIYAIWKLVRTYD